MKNYTLFSMLTISVINYGSDKAILKLSPVKSFYYKENNEPIANALDEGFLRTIKSLFNVNIFIETGTFLGESSARAARIFREVHTIEIDLNLYNMAWKKLNKFPNVKCYLGDSGRVLSTILKQVTAKTLFWLDGHYSGPNHAGYPTGKGNEVSPIFGELNAIKQSGLKNSVILIDDIRCFDILLPNNDPVFSLVMGYPDILDVVTAIKQINQEYKIKLFGDIIIAYIDDIAVSELIEACTVSRLFDERFYTLAQLFDAEKYIANAEGPEKAIIERLSDGTLEVIYNQLGWGKHFIWWKALKLSKTNPEAAYRLLELAYKVGLRHWRVKYLMAQMLKKMNHGVLAQKLIDECRSVYPQLTDFDLSTKYLSF